MGNYRTSWFGRLRSNSLEAYRAVLVSREYKAWRIEAAIGFYGFVIARSAEQIGT